MPAIDMIWKARETSKTPPLIGDQYIAMGKQVLCLRNPMPADSAFMGKMYVVCNTMFVLFFICYLWPELLGGKDSAWSTLWDVLAFYFIMGLFVAWRTYLIRSQSNFVFNRETQKVYYRKRKHLYVGEWRNVQAGMVTQTEWSGASFSTSYGLIICAFDNTPDNPSKSDTLHNKIVALPVRSIVIDSNEPNDPRVDFVGQVWSYIQHFMAHGPEGLPVPQEPHWWHVPHNRICLTPVQAWRHYAPWCSGEPGERQGKKWWLLPFWLITFPYNLFAALCWWITCKLFRVKPMAIPPEAMEGETGPLVTLEMASQGIKP
ncbi:DUF6708 domain-containing protein [Dyella japonica]|uniref:DUF6708 domain-containing protein n=1 Tax=Dyella japonica TaxID=231455 RepID=A0ABV2K104_9GAMM